MARVSSSEKPLAMRSITVAARWPERNSCIACTISGAGRPSMATTGEPSRAGAWQPEHAAAPGGTGACADADADRPTRIAASEARRAIMRGPERGGRAATVRRRAPSGRSRPAEVVVLERQVADALAGRGEDRVEHGRRRDRDRRLADAAPEAAGRDRLRLDRRHLVDAHYVVGVEVLLLDPAALDGALAVERRREAVDEGALDLPRHLLGIDDVAGIGRGDDAMDLELAAVERHLRPGGDVAAEAH